MKTNKIPVFIAAAALFAFGLTTIAINLGWEIDGWEFIGSEKDFSWIRKTTFLLSMFLFGYQQAGSDFKPISKGVNLDGKDHILRWIYRGSIAYLISILIFNKYYLFYLAPAAGIFSLVFNLYLNDYRSKSLKYISGSNLYDKVFLYLFSSYAFWAQKFFEVLAILLIIKLN